MRKTIAAFAAGAIVATLIIGGRMATATPNDPCASRVNTKGNSVSGYENYRYLDCRLDRQDAALKRIEAELRRQGSRPPSPSVTPTKPQPASPTATPVPTPTGNTSATAIPSRTPSPPGPVTPSPSTSSTVAPRGSFPDTTSTGVPEGTALTAYNGPLTITTANTVIDAKRITGTLTIRALNVVIRNSEINGSIYNDENGPGSSFTITDSSVKVVGLITGISSRNFTATRVEVTGGNRSINCWMDCVVRESLVWKQARPDPTTHQSGIRLGARSTLIGNTIACDAPDVPPDGGCSAPITGYGDFAQVRDILVQGNLVKATTGGFCAYGGSSSGKPHPQADNVRFIDNTFERRASSQKTPATCGYFGTVTSWVAEPGSEFLRNVYTDGTPVPAG